MVKLEVRGIACWRGRVQVLRDAEFTVEEGETVGILGPNGVGKSTLLGTIMGVFPPRSGEVRLGGKPVTGLTPEQMVRRGVALVPERRQIFAPLTVRENLHLGAYHRWRDSRAVARDLEGVLALFPGLVPLLERPAGRLSGGEQQMVAIGRGLMAGPRVLMLDEPSLGLAPKVRGEIFRTLGKLAEEGTTIVLVEQNLRAALRVCRRGYLMEKGRMVFGGPAAEVSRIAGAGYMGNGDPDGEA